MCASVAGSVIPEAVILKQICPGPVAVRVIMRVATPFPFAAPVFGTSLTPVKPANRTQPPPALNGAIVMLDVLGAVAAGTAAVGALVAAWVAPAVAARAGKIACGHGG